ncbi:MAG: AAA family ATPase [Kiritimatiellia bacterium]|nr:AAA family ATPase [Kiritimatiellia bacterium]
MYNHFFELREKPFNITPDPRFLYFSAQHREALDQLIYGIESRAGFIALVGEVGCGKTTLCRAMLARLPHYVESALVLNPCLTEIQLVQAILTDLGSPFHSRDRLKLIASLNEYLLDKMRKGINVVVILDEAQQMTPALLEQVRLLSNLETDQQKLMQIILSGQPELDQRLQEPGLRQLRQRIMMQCRLTPLDEPDTAGYIRHRLSVAGAPEDVGFDEAAVRLIHRRSGGIPRLINKLSDRALLAAYAVRARRVGREEARRALAEMEGLT